MKLLDILDQSGLKYEITEHRPTFTAQRMAAIAHERIMVFRDVLPSRKPCCTERVRLA